MPPEWLDPSAALETLRVAKLRVPRLRSGQVVFEDLRVPESLGCAAERIDAFEVYCGSANWSTAVLEEGLQVGFLCDWRLPPWATGHCTTTDLLSSWGRQVVWAFLVIFQPAWVHAGFPCTWWTDMCHFTRESTDREYRAGRLEALAHVRLSTQVLNWQCGRGAAGSFEQPPRCRSYQLSWIRSLVAACHLAPYTCDSCAWGLRDPESGRPWLKPQRFNANRDLRAICRRCRCSGGRRRKGVHQVVQGAIGSRHRTTLSGEYPPALCQELARAVRAEVAREP